MKRGVAAASAVLLGAFTTLGAADNYTMETISVESSTITNEAAGRTEASTVNYIDQELIEQINPKQLNEVLQTVPGVTADFMGNEVVEIHIRGINQQEFMWEDTGVAIIVDGVPVYAKSGKFRLNMSDITSIKVIKGSAAYLYGNRAMAGAIVITTSKPRGGDDAYSVSAEAGSFNAQDYEATARISRESFAASLNANYRKSDGYWVDSAYWNKSLSGKLSYYIDDTSDVTLGIDKTLKYEEQKRASSTGVTAADANPRGTAASGFQKDNEVDLDKYILTYTKEFANGGNLLLNVYDYIDEYDYISSPQDTDGDGIGDTYARHTLEHKKQKGAKLEFKQELADFAYLVGYEFGDRQYQSGSETLIDYNSTDVEGNPVANYAGELTHTNDDQRLHAFYGELKYAVTPAWTAVFNMRHDIQKDMYEVVSHDYNGTDWNNEKLYDDHTYNENGYRVGTTYAVDADTTLYANISTGYRTPTVDKMVTNYENRNRTDGVAVPIDVERSITYEVGARGNLGGHLLDYELSVFQMDTKDIIGYRFGTYSFATSGGITDNIGDARNRGVELSLKSDPTRRLSFNLAYTYLKAEFTKHDPVKIAYRGPEYDIVGNELPRTPNNIFDLYTTIRFSPNLKVIGQVYAQSEYYADETNMIKMPGYAFLNLQARYTMHVGGNELECYVKVNNVFDEHYYQTVYFTGDKSGDGTFDREDPTITVAPGKEYFAGLIYRF
ncbi:TonB-dependent receptor [Sulfurimonas diazotrophicus]|uniref:TonB-dependent receptor n=1 Tax=Sulfurimonas diazotrophicus TaxID=3131939 RepID=A0ABZ3HA10_9BACT